MKSWNTQTSPTHPVSKVAASQSQIKFLNCCNNALQLSYRNTTGDFVTFFFDKQSIPSLICQANRSSCLEVRLVRGSTEGSLQQLSRTPRLFLRYPSKSPYCAYSTTTSGRAEIREISSLTISGLQLTIYSGYQLFLDLFTRHLSQLIMFMTDWISFRIL